MPPSVIEAVMMQESGGNERAVSSAGAMGLMQLMPGTWKAWNVKDPFDAQSNITAGALHLKTLLNTFKGNLRLALAAYNAGSGAVMRHRGIPPYKETIGYVNSIMRRLGQ